MSDNQLTDDQVKTVCQPGTTTCCSYLMMAPGGFECAKGTSAEGLLAERRRLKTMRALGDNCSGPPDFKVSD